MSDQHGDVRLAANERRARQRLQRSSGRTFWIRTIAVGIFDALALWVIINLAANRSWAVMTLLIVALALINWAYLNPRAQASRWLTPGLVLMVIFVLYPVLYTAYISFTNYQTGNLLSRDQAIERLEAVDIASDGVGQTLQMSVYRNPSGDLGLLVSGPDTDPFFGPIRAGVDDTDVVPLAELPPDFDPASPPETLGEFALLPRLAITGEASRLENAGVNLPDGSFARVQTFSQAVVVTTGKRFTYDASANVLIDNQTDRICPAGQGTFFCDGVPEDEVQRVAIQARDSTIVCSAGVCDNVPLYALNQTFAGWRQVIGFDNYVEVLTNERIRDPFIRVLTWNVAFAVGSVLLNFMMGLGLALALKRDDLRGRSIYRSIYIIPYAVPAFLSILVWRGLLNPQFGKVNGVLNTFGLPDVNWLGDASNAMIAIFLVNLWLGFPYMFLICSGALTSIPEELLEAAKVDGAGAWKSFRMITLPLLLVSTAPLLIGAFAFNFNNFVLIFLLTDGGPPLTGYDVPVGATDLLISFTFDIAAGAGRGSQFSLATAIIVIIFIVLATTSAFSFRLTKKLEDIYDQT
jgi:arabinogalactan oligomer / maltooligosaccharide transport system permease protein